MWGRPCINQSSQTQIALAWREEALASRQHQPYYHFQLFYRLPVAGMALSALRERVIVLCKSELGLEPDTASSRADAYLQFIKLKAEHPEAALAPSHAVDEVWHTHILDTRSYAELMRLLLPDGSFVHHNPVHNEQPNYEARYATTVSLLRKQSRYPLDKDSWGLDQSEYKTLNTLVRTEGTQKIGPPVVCHRKQSIMQLIDCLKLLLNCKRIIVTGLDVSSAPHSRQTVSQTSLWQQGTIVVTVFEANETQAIASPHGSNSTNFAVTEASALDSSLCIVVFCYQKLKYIARSHTTRLRCKAAASAAILSIKTCNNVDLDNREAETHLALMNCTPTLNMKLKVRVPIIKTSNAALATAAAAVRTHTNNPFPVIEAHASSNDSSDTLSYTATVQQAIDMLQLLQRGQSTTPLTAQSILYIESEIVSKTGYDIARGVAIAYNGIDLNELDRQSTLADNDMWEGATLTATASVNTAEYGSMRIIVKTLRGQTLTVQCAPDWTIARCKLAITKLDGTPVSDQRLIFAGQQLEEDMLLGQYNIQKESTLHLILRLRGC
eukprot:19905-Heterococcus_DN1.PRE.1